MHARKLLGRVPKGVLWLCLASLTGRRQLNLERWTHEQTFVDLHRTIVAWLDSHIEAIEDGAPWLHRVGIDVCDFCKGAIYSPFDFSLQRRRRASADCTRSVIAVYGFDGDLAQRLDDLAGSLTAAGWTRVGPRPLKAWVDAEDATLRWRPGAALSYPPEMEGKAPLGAPSLTPLMWLSWYSRGQTLRLQQDPNRTLSGTRNYMPVESSGTEYWRLPDTAWEAHDYVLVVQLNLGYYSNPDPLARPHRIPRYLSPTPVR